MKEVQGFNKQNIYFDTILEDAELTCSKCGYKGISATKNSNTTNLFENKIPVTTNDFCCPKCKSNEFILELHWDVQMFVPGKKSE